jgi:hypothetical protein
MAASLLNIVVCCRREISGYLTQRQVKVLEVKVLEAAQFATSRIDGDETTTTQAQTPC